MKDNCLASRHEIEEANLGQPLSESATEHMGGCAKCQDFYESRLKLRQMVAGLGTVEAPADFDFRVRARIASEQVGAPHGFSFGNLAIGFPSIALGTLVLLVGAGFAVRVWNSPTNSATAVRTEAPDVNQPNLVVEQNPSAEELIASRGNHEELAVDAESKVRDAKKQRTQVRRSVVSLRNKSAVATHDFSSAPAPVIKQEDAIASLETSRVFLIEASSQPLRVSLDYAKGGSRTISVPTLSFGSERVLTGEGSSNVRTSTKGVW